MERETNLEILEISDELSHTGLSVKERLQVLSERINKLLKKRCCIYMVNENEKRYFYLLAGHPKEYHGIGKKFSFDEHRPLEKVLREKKSVLIEDIETSSLLTREQKEWSRGEETKSILFVPIMFLGEVLGIVVLDILRDDEISGEEIDLVQQITSHIAWAIVNATTYEKLQRKERALAKAVRLATLGEEWLKLAHELRNPLATLGGFAERLAGSFSEGDSRKEIAEIIVREVKRMEECLKNHLEFGREETPLAPLDLNSLILESLNDFKKQSNFPKEQIEIEFSSQFSPVLASSFQLKKVFLNIFKNAQEAMEGGKVEKSFIWVRTWRENKFVCVEISNSSFGQKIPGEILDKIFEPFFTTKKESAGLGLSVVYQILDLHDAEIYCQSDEEKTSFLMRFPLTL